MKLTELILEHSLEIEAEQALRDMDWNYDLNIDEIDNFRLRRGASSLKKAEALIARLYDINEEAARKLWETYCPYASTGSLPSSMFRK